MSWFSILFTRCLSPDSLRCSLSPLTRFVFLVYIVVVNLEWCFLWSYSGVIWTSSSPQLILSRAFCYRRKYVYTNGLRCRRLIDKPPVPSGSNRCSYSSRDTRHHAFHSHVHANTEGILQVWLQRKCIHYSFNPKEATVRFQDVSACTDSEMLSSTQWSSQGPSLPPRAAPRSTRSTLLRPKPSRT